MTNVVNPDFVYQTLGQGISQINSSFNTINFTSLEDAEFEGEATQYQIITTLRNGTSHSLFFNPNAAAEYDYSAYGLGPDYGFDYVGNTTSMTTQCAMVNCNISTIASSSISLDQNNLSVPFHCYDDFSGDLGQTPRTGHERAQGWNMSFYDLTDGSPQNIPVQAQSNPFHFYAAAAVNSITFSDLQDSGSPDSNSSNGSLVDVGGGFVAFALRCEATIYDVKFSLNNGSFYGFHVNKSSPQMASVIKAPLQVGFGQYHLYEAARLAAVSNDKSLADTMGTAFSQVGMALASGAFDFDNDTLVRFRWTVDVTKIEKAPYWFLVVVCLLYSAFGLVMTVLAFLLRRNSEVREQRAKLMNKHALELEEKVVANEIRKERDRSSERGSVSITDVSI